MLTIKFYHTAVANVKNDQPFTRPVVTMDMIKYGKVELGLRTSVIRNLDGAAMVAEIMRKE
jgi:hypothetical protein